MSRAGRKLEAELCLQKVLHQAWER